MSSSGQKDPTLPPNKLRKKSSTSNLAAASGKEVKRRKSSFFQKLSLAFRHKSSNPDPPLRSPGPSTGSVQLRNHLELRDGRPQNDEPENQYETVLDTQLGELKDNTKYLHSLFYDENAKDEEYHQRQKEGDHLVRPEDHVISKVPKNVWANVIEYLEPSDACALTLSTKLLLNTIGPDPNTFLNLPENRHHRIQFLLYLDKHLPMHLLCFLCASYHLRLNPGKEVLKPAAVYNPLYNCPKALTEKFPRTRITPRRNLPFGFAQLVMRAKTYGPEYGLPIDNLSRRWTEEAWSHQSRFAIIKDHLFMRVTSSVFVRGGLTSSEERLLLYSREDYTPYFSACSHWRDGLLMPVCKCALSHIPKPIDLGGLQKVGKQLGDKIHSRTDDLSSIVTLCENCRPMRRCPECPSEYLIEMKRMEDRKMEGGGFKRAMCVTRWADLGDGRTPYRAEWAAINGELREGQEYDSFKKVGKRAISGIFESHLTEDTIPAQPMLSLNPKMEKHSDVDDPAWY